MKAEANIVEAQFFLWSQNVSIRFFDGATRITELVVQIEKLVKRRDEMVLAASKTKGLRRKILCWRCDSLSRKISLLSAFKRHRVARQLTLALQDKQEIALQCRDYSFRPMRPDEMEDLSKWVTEARGIWLFLFKPGNLLSDTQASLAVAW